MCTNNIRKLYVVQNKSTTTTEDECSDCNTYKGMIRAMVVIQVIVAIAVAIAYVWVYYFEPRYINWKKKMITKPGIPVKAIEEPIRHPNHVVIMNEPLDIDLSPKINEPSDCGFGNKLDCGYGNRFLRWQEKEKKLKEDQDLLKIGIYSKKEATREFRWFNKVKSMDVLVPNLTKKLKKSTTKSIPTYAELEIIKDGDMMISGLSSFGIPPFAVKSAKVVAFTESKILVPFAINGEAEFGVIVPVSEGLKLKVESDVEEPVLDQSKDIDEPILFRADDSILIEQTETSPKQFILFRIRTPLSFR